LFSLCPVIQWAILSGFCPVPKICSCRGPGMITYCVMCGKPLDERDAANKAITHRDPQSYRREWRNRWKRVKKSYRVTPEEFRQVLKLRRAAKRKPAILSQTVQQGVGHCPTHQERSMQSSHKANFSRTEISAHGGLP